MRSYQKHAKKLQAGDYVVAKNGVPCLVTEAKRFTDRKTVPHRQLMGILYEAGEGDEKEIMFAAFSLRFPVLVADKV